MKNNGLSFFRNQIDFFDNQLLIFLAKKQSILTTFGDLNQKKIFSYLEKIENQSYYNSVVPSVWFFDLIKFIQNKLNQKKKSQTTILNSSDFCYSYLQSLDFFIYQILVNRFLIAIQIGQLKKEKNTKIIDIKRWDNLIKDKVHKAEKLNLSSEIIIQIMEKIHQHSIVLQNGI